MTLNTSSLGISSLNGSIIRGHVVAVDQDGYLIVRTDPEAQHRCEMLQIIPGQPAPSIGATVLIFHADDAADGASIVLGQLGTVAPGADSPAEYTQNAASVTPPTERPDFLVLEAKESLTLRVGDGSITIRADGKILIKGKDLVSHAQRTNRIKGGSVAIN